MPPLQNLSPEPAWPGSWRSRASQQVPKGAVHQCKGSSQKGSWQHQTAAFKFTSWGSPFLFNTDLLESVTSFSAEAQSKDLKCTSSVHPRLSKLLHPSFSRSAPFGATPGGKGSRALIMCVISWHPQTQMESHIPGLCRLRIFQAFFLAIRGSNL